MSHLEERDRARVESLPELKVADRQQPVERRGQVGGIERLREPAEMTERIRTLFPAISRAAVHRRNVESGGDFFGGVDELQRVLRTPLQLNLHLIQHSGDQAFGALKRRGSQSLR